MAWVTLRNGRSDPHAQLKGAVFAKAEAPAHLACGWDGGSEPRGTSVHHYVGGPAAAPWACALLSPSWSPEAWGCGWCPTPS